VGRYKRLFRLGAGKPSDLHRELEQEIETHIALRTEALVKQGVEPAFAREQALQRFGDIESAKRQLYASARQREDRLRWRTAVDDVRRDV